MDALRIDVGLNDEPAAARSNDTADTEASVRTGQWVAASLAPDATTSGHAAYSDLSSFRDLTELHLGRHSTVWSAVCKRTGRTVVIKGYNTGSLKQRQLNNVRREISLLSFFRESGCKGVVAMLAAFEDKSMIYLVFEACMRGDLYQLLMRNRGTLHEEFVVTKIVFPLLCVLQQLHKLHVVHRDIKPENIFVTEDGDIALGDFGLAGHKYQDHMTERVGTLDYMAPEVLCIPAPAEGERNSEDEPSPADASKSYDEKVDIWATGILVYELLVGQPPFEVDDPKETARLILSGQATNYPVHISQYARDFVAQALTKDPARRPSAEELLQHSWLRHYFGGKVPDAAAGSSGVSAGQLKSWLVANWSDPSKPGSALKPNSVVPNRLFFSPAGSPRKVLSSSDGLASGPQLASGSRASTGTAFSHRGTASAVAAANASASAASRPPFPPQDDDIKPAPHYKRKSVPGGSDAGSDSPRDREGVRKQYDAVPHHERSESSSLDRQLQMSLESGEPALDGSVVDTGAVNQLGASQYPSRDSSAGSMDQAVPNERTYVRNDSGASASSGISIASFASLQHVPRSSSVGEMGQEEELGVAPRSASVCAANMSRPPVGFPAGTTQLKPVWAAPQAPSCGGNRKTPGKSRFAG